MKTIDVKYAEPIISECPIAGGSRVHPVRYTKRSDRQYSYVTEDNDAAVGDLYLVCPSAGLRAVKVVAVRDYLLPRDRELKLVLVRLAIQMDRCNVRLCIDGARAPSDHTAAYADYIVMPGDSLASIASRYNSSVGELLRLNPQYVANPNMIFPGQHIRIPKSQPSNAQPTGRYYTVQHGDTLTNIASRMHTSVSDLLHLNPHLQISPTPFVFPGERVILPTTSPNMAQAMMSRRRAVHLMAQAMAELSKPLGPL